MWPATFPDVAKVTRQRRGPKATAAPTRPSSSRSLTGGICSASCSVANRTVRNWAVAGRPFGSTSIRQPSTPIEFSRLWGLRAPFRLSYVASVGP